MILSNTPRALTVDYSLWTVRMIFFGPLADGMEEVKETPMLIPMIAFAVIAVVIGVYPRIVLDYLLPFFGEAVSTVY